MVKTRQEKNKKGAKTHFVCPPFGLLASRLYSYLKSHVIFTEQHVFRTVRLREMACRILMTDIGRTLAISLYPAFLDFEAAFDLPPRHKVMFVVGSINALNLLVAILRENKLHIDNEAPNYRPSSFLATKGDVAYLQEKIF